MKLDERKPTDHRLSMVYRVGSGLTGGILFIFGTLGFLNQLAFFDTQGEQIFGLSSNGLLSLISVTVGTVLVVAMIIGGNVASTLNMAVGAAFVLSGFINLILMGTPYNILAFQIQNVIFSFVVGLIVLVFGMYGRVSGGLPHDNPYWRRRNPAEAAAEDRATAGERNE